MNQMSSRTQCKVSTLCVKTNANPSQHLKFPLFQECSDQCRNSPSRKEMLCKIARMNGMRQPIQTALNGHSLYQDPSDENNETSHQAQDVSTANAKPRSKRTSQFQRGSHRSQPFMQCSTAPHPWDEEMQFDFPPTPPLSGNITDISKSIPILT